jgi:hypothetical protein
LDILVGLKELKRVGGRVGGEKASEEEGDLIANKLNLSRSDA